MIKSNIYVFYMILFLFVSLVMFFISPNAMDETYLIVALLFVFFSLFYFFDVRKKAGLSKRPFSLTLLFVLSYIIVFFQFPLDVLLSSFSDRSLHHTIIYDERVFIKSVWYLVSFFVLLTLGMGFQANKFKKCSVLNTEYRIIGTRSFYLLFYVFFILHIVTVNPGYYDATNDRELSGIANSILGYFVILLPICFGVTIYNYKIKSNNAFGGIGIKEYIKLFPLTFILIILLFSFVTFLAGDRGPAIRALILLVFGYYIVSNKSVSYFKFFSLLIFAGFFLSTIKLVGAINYNEDIVNSFISASERLNESAKSESISPYTAELSASFRSYNIAFSLWYSGYSLYALGAVVGFLMGIPYAVTIFMKVFDLNSVDVNSSNFITDYVGESYGLGTSIVGDALLNTGFVFPLFLAFFIGRLFMKIDLSFFMNTSNVFIYSIGMYYLMTSVVLARASIFPTVGNSLFIVFIICFVIYVNKKY